MQALALLFVAFVGLASCQQYGNGGYPDQGIHPGASSQGKHFDPYYGNAQYGGGAYGAPAQQQHGGNTYPDQGKPAGGSSRKLDPLGGAPFGGAPFGGAAQQQPGNQGGLNQVNVGNAPLGGSSGGRPVGFAPVANPGPVQGQVNHQNQGAPPTDTGGNSGLKEYPLGPVQSGMHNNVDMVNMGSPPQQGNSGEFIDYGAGYGGAVAGNGAAVNGQTGDFAPNAPQTAGGEAVLGQPGGSSGNGGNAYNAGNYADNTGANSPLGGAEISDLTQQEAGKASHSRGVGGMGTAAVGVVIAVLVLVGIVGVAAVFLIRQRRSRMGMSQV